MQDSFKLILNSKTFLIPCKFPSFSNVSIEIYSTLLSKREYHVKSHVSSKAFQNFLNNWTKNETIQICSSNNITEYSLLSNEFERIKNIIKIYRNCNQNKTKTYLHSRNHGLQSVYQKNQDSLIEAKTKYHQIIHTLFTSSLIIPRINLPEIYAQLFTVCNSGDVGFVNEFSKKKNPF